MIIYDHLVFTGPLHCSIMQQQGWCQGETRCQIWLLWCICTYFLLGNESVLYEINFIVAIYMLPMMLMMLMMFIIESTHCSYTLILSWGKVCPPMMSHQHIWHNIILYICHIVIFPFNFTIQSYKHIFQIAYFLFFSFYSLLAWGIGFQILKMNTATESKATF